MMNQHKIFVTVLLVLSTVSLNTFAQTQFSGGWKLNVKLSDFGGLMQATAAPSSINARIADSVVVIRYFEGLSPMRENLLFNAKEVETLPDGNTLKKAKVTWLKEPKAIRFNWYYEVGGNEWHYTRTETWNLSPDGKTLTIDRITTLPDKIDKVKAVYQRII